MKKFFENIIVATVTVFFILSIAYNVYIQTYSKAMIKSKENQINDASNAQIKEDIVELSSEFSLDEALDMKKYLYIYDIANANVKIISISAIFGVIIAAIYSSNENKNLKEVSTYILTFIFGHVLFNSFYSIINVFVFGNIGIPESFTTTYVNMSTKTIVGYVIIYVAIAFWYNISKAERDELKNKKLKKVSKTVKKNVEKNEAKKEVKSAVKNVKKEETKK